MVYVSISAFSDHFAAYTSQFSTMYLSLARAPWRAPGLLLESLPELLLYSAPAATLMPAGLRLLFRQSRLWHIADSHLVWAPSTQASP